MVRKKPINCPHCKKFTGSYDEDFMFYVLTSDFLCPHCKKIVIKANVIEYNQADKQNPNVYTQPQQININNDLKFE